MSRFDWAMTAAHCVAVFLLVTWLLDGSDAKAPDPLDQLSDRVDTIEQRLDRLELRLDELRP